MTLAEPAVLLALEKNVATVTLNRPAVMNALDLATAEALARSLSRCAGDPAIRAVVLTGAGRGFCAGGDMRAAREHILAGGKPSDFFGDLTQPLHRAISDIRAMPKPIVAAVNGVAAGAGLSIAVACDLRVAAETATFKQAYTSIGLVPDGGWSALVPRIVGVAEATRLLLADPVLDAAQALRLGLVHEVVSDAAARAQEHAASLAGGPTSAFARAKRLVNAALFPDLEAQLERERQAIMRQGGTADFAEGLAAFAEKRKPVFPGSPV